ncbi:MAG: tetratricopeptide repeat protein [Rubrivivax sp.]|nr:tetratricopeptide repeat protein [Rubrivivax sp.]
MLSEATRLVQEAMVAHRAGRLQEAEGHYLQALALEADNPDALHLHALLLVSLGRLEQAARQIARAIELTPGVAIFHNNHGNVLMQLDRLDEAEQQYRQAIILDSDRIDAMNNLGVLLCRRGQHADAEIVLKRLVELVPQFSDARQNLAQLYIVTGRLAEAVDQCLNGLVTSPQNRGLRHVLGLAYGALGWVEQAVELYRKWLEEDPEDVRARHHYSAYTGEGVAERASAAYIRMTFDHFADGFENKLADLDYRAPSLVGEALATALGAPQGALRILDAGCGTGLCATFLKPYARELAGVDLSRPMLERAAVKRAYDELRQADLVDFLQSRPAAFDVVVSADTLCYFGVLDGFAQAARRSLADGGWLFFTVEAVEDEQAEPPWRLQTHGRYCHRRAYVEQTLTAAGFQAPRIESVFLRNESKKPVAGWLVSATTC